MDIRAKQLEVLDEVVRKLAAEGIFSKIAVMTDSLTIIVGSPSIANINATLNIGPSGSFGAVVNVYNHASGRTSPDIGWQHPDFVQKVKNHL